MKLALITAVMCSGSAWAAGVDEDMSRKIVQTGEVISSRAYIQPKLGFDLLIRHEGGIFLCQVSQDTRFGYNGASNTEFVVVERCISQATD